MKNMRWLKVVLFGVALTSLALGGRAALANRVTGDQLASDKVRRDPPAQPAALEAPPPYFYGTGAIPPGYRKTIILNRFASLSSRILLSVDTTAWPGGDVSLPGVKVRARGNGYFEVATLDGSLAPASGVPFNFVVFNTSSVGSSIIGTAQIAAGTHNVGVNLGSITANSIVLLTVDTTSTGYDSLLTGLKVNNHGAGFFTVTTLDLSNPPVTLPFTYLVVNSDFQAGTGKIPSGIYNVGFSNFTISNPTAVFVTVDATTIPGADVSLPGVKVNNHGGSFFTVTTDRLATAPATGVPFNYLILQPPQQWEELGPYSRSANSWTIVADPFNRFNLYVGSEWGGVFKTTNGGDTWTAAWQGQPLVGITRLTMPPGNTNRLFGLARDGYVWQTNDGGSTWARLPNQVPGLTGTYGQGGYLATNGPNTVYVCSDAGLYSLTVPGTTWTTVAVGPAGTHQCSDFVVASSGFYAAFRDIGVWANLGGGFVQVKSPISVPITPTGTLVPNAPIRVAVGTNRIVLNYGCEIYTNSLSNLSSPESNHTWSYKGRRCYTSQNGYDLAAAISPTDPNHFIVSGNEAQVTRDGGATWSGHLPVGQDDHEVVFWNDNYVYMATDNGPRVSSDGGSTWREAETNSFITDGPPTKEYYDLSVSLGDQFGRAYVGGNAQDSGAVAIVGRSAGFGSCGGEDGLFKVAPQPTSVITFDGRRASHFRTYETYESDPTHLLVGDVTVRGPDFRSPQSPGDEGYSTLPGQFDEEGYYPRPTCAQASTTFPSGIAVIAVANASGGNVLIGLDDGSVWRATSGTNGTSYQPIGFASPTPVTAIYFAADSTAYVGWQSGTTGKITSSFATTPITGFITAPASGTAIVSFASRYGDATEVYAATNSAVYRTTNGGSNWLDVTGADLGANLAQGMEIAGLARDLNHPYLYAAVGHRRFWYGGGASFSNVWRSSAPVTTTSWVTISQGLPTGLPISDIGISPDRALYIATDGRGIWWRRDVASNVGLSDFSPSIGSSDADLTTTFTLTWTHPIKWRDLNTLDLRLRDGDDIPVWVRFTEGVTSTLSLLDSTGNILTTGLPGDPIVLESNTARFDLEHSSFLGTGPTGPSVTVKFAVSVKPVASARTYSIELLATDDFDNAQGPDRVGTWTVFGPYKVYLPIALLNAP